MLKLNENTLNEPLLINTRFCALLVFKKACLSSFSVSKLVGLVVP